MSKLVWVNRYFDIKIIDFHHVQLLLRFGLNTFDLIIAISYLYGGLPLT